MSFSLVPLPLRQGALVGRGRLCPSPLVGRGQGRVRTRLRHVVRRPQVLVRRHAASIRSGGCTGHSHRALRGIPVALDRTSCRCQINPAKMTPFCRLVLCYSIRGGKTIHGIGGLQKTPRSIPADAARPLQEWGVAFSLAHRCRSTADALWLLRHRIAMAKNARLVLAGCRALACPVAAAKPGRNHNQRRRHSSGLIQPPTFLTPGTGILRRPTWQVGVRTSR